MNALYRNNADGTFSDVAKDLGIADVNKKETGVSMGAVWGDFDNDGFEDLLVYKWGKTELFKNNRREKFFKSRKHRISRLGEYQFGHLV